MPAATALNILPQLEKHVEAISAIISHITILHNRRKSNILSGGEKEALSYLGAEIADAIKLCKGNFRNGRRDLRIIDLPRQNELLQDEFLALVSNINSDNAKTYVDGVAESLASIRQTIEKQNRSGFWES